MGVSLIGQHTIHEFVSDAFEFAVDRGLLVWQLVLAAACGAVIGWQRVKKDKAAGLRTLMGLAIGACVFAPVGVIQSS